MHEDSTGGEILVQGYRKIGEIRRHEDRTGGEI